VSFSFTSPRLLQIRRSTCTLGKGINHSPDIRPDSVTSRKGFLATIYSHRLVSNYPALQLANTAFD
jgi:hypothetical protein